MEQFETSPLAAGRLIHRLLVNDRAAFAKEGLALLEVARPSRAFRRLVHLLIEHDVLLDHICDREASSVEQAAILVRGASRVDPMLDAKLLRGVLARVARSDPALGDRLVPETLAVFDAAGFGNRLLPMLVQLLRNSDAQVRSKVALLLGRANKQVAWALDDADPRVRANAVESLWRSGAAPVRKLLWKAAHDPHNRVAGNAMLGLLYLQDRGVIPCLERAARHNSPLFRATAAWVMGQSGDPAFQTPLEEMAADSDENVRRNAHRALTLLPKPEEPEPVAQPAEEPGVPPDPDEPDAGEAAEEIDEAAGGYAPIRGLTLLSRRDAGRPRR